MLASCGLRRCSRWVRFSLSSPNPVEENTAFIRETETAALLSLLVLSDINSPCHVNEELFLHTTQTTHLCPAEGALKLFIFPPASVTFTLHRKQHSLDIHLILSLFVGIYVMWFFLCVCFHQAETELRIAQSEFDRQAEITRLLLEGIGSTHVRSHILCVYQWFLRHCSKSSTMAK